MAGITARLFSRLAGPAIASAASSLASRIVAQYESLRWPQGGRRRPPPETGPDDRDNLPLHERRLSIAEGRHLHRNDLMVGGMLHTIRTLAVGASGGNPVFCTPDKEWNAKAQPAWRRYAKRCDWRGTGVCWSDAMGLGLVSVLRDGDVLTVWDEALLEGGCLWYEADQLVEVPDQEWRAQAAALGFAEPDPVTGVVTPYLQSSGVVRDRYGRVRGYITTADYGQQCVPMARATAWRPGQCRLTMQAYRFNQYRGNSSLIAMLSAVSDVRQMVLSEIQTGKRTAQEALLVKQKRPPLMGNGLTDLGVQPATQRYEDLEEAYGGAVAYVAVDEDMKILGNDRPAPQVRQFAEWVSEAAGKSLGLFPVFTTGKISNPASARLEVLLTWAAFRVWQKVLERGPIDFVVPRVVDLLARRGEIPPCPVPVEECYQVEWPSMPLLTPKEEIEAAVARIKAGGSDFATEFGPTWPETVRRLAEQKNLLTEELALEFISVFETVSGTNMNQRTQRTDGGSQA